MISTTVLNDMHFKPKNRYTTIYICSYTTLRSAHFLSHSTTADVCILKYDLNCCVCPTSSNKPLCKTTYVLTNNNYYRQTINETNMCTEDLIVV